MLTYKQIRALPRGTVIEHDKDPTYSRILLDDEYIHIHMYGWPEMAPARWMSVDPDLECLFHVVEYPE